MKYYLLILFVALLNACAPEDLTTRASDDSVNQNHLNCHVNNATSNIVNGREVLAQETLSKQAVLIIIRRDTKISSCTGVPISRNVILTAAHCINDASSDNVSVIFHTDMKCSTGYTEQKISSADKLVIHNGFDKTPQSHADLALIKINNSIPSDYHIASFYDGSSALSSDDVLMLGYGITDETKQDSLILRTTYKSFKNDSYLKSPLLLFTQDNPTGGFCRGDSGAPVYVNVNGLKKLIGINSFNLGTVENKECHTASASMYVPFYAQWIRSELLKLQK